MVKGEPPAIQIKLEEEVSAIQMKPQEEPATRIKREHDQAQSIDGEQLAIQAKPEEELCIQIKLEEESSAQNMLVEQPLQIKLEEEPVAIQIKLEEELSVMRPEEELATRIKIEEESSALNRLEGVSPIQNMVGERLPAIQAKVEEEPVSIQIELEEESLHQNLQSSGKVKPRGILCKISTTAAKRRAIKGVFPSAPKRKRTVMTLRDKVRVLDALRSGRSVASVSRHFSVNESTVRSIRQKEDDIRQRVRESAPETAKVTSVVRDKAMEKMEKRLSIWINEMIGIKGSILDATSIRLKAKEIYEHVTENQEDVKPFSASAGWLFRFKNRYGFKNAKLSGEAGPADVEAAEEFVELLLKIIEEKGYQPEQVFNTDEACLLYKQTGSRTYLSKTVAKARGFKVFKDRATLLFCANARGDFKGNPLMVYRSQNPRVLKGKDLNDLPVIWKWNPKAWMTAEIFWDWFNNHFIPAVEQYLAQKNLVFKVLLILDNAPAHIHPDLENAHPNVEVLFMPPNVTSALQPMEQGIIKAFKSHYTQELYRNACQHLDANPDSTMVDFWKSVTICDVIDYVKVAWGRVSQATINNCWKAAWRQSVTDFIGFNGVDAQIKKNVEVIVSLARRIGGDGFDDMKEEDVAEILTQPAIEFTNEELDAMAKEGCKDSDEEEQEEDEVEVAPKIAPLTIAKLEKWASLMDEVSRDIQESDPLVERSLKFQRQLEHVFHPYAKLLKELRWRSRQTTLPQFFTPVRTELSLLQPSTSQEVSSTEEEASDGDVELPSLELKEKNTVLESIVSEKLEKSLHWRGME